MGKLLAHMLVLVLAAWPPLAAAAGSDATTEPAAVSETAEGDDAVGDEEIGPLVLLLMIGVASLVLIGAGAVIGLVVLASAAVLLTMGIISSSTLIGLLRRRPGPAIRAFFIQVGAVAGIPFGIGAFWIATRLLEWKLTLALTAAIGACCGLVCGIVVALLFNFASNRMYRWVAARFGPHSGAKPRPDAPHA